MAQDSIKQVDGTKASSTVSPHPQNVSVRLPKYKDQKEEEDRKEKEEHKDDRRDKVTLHSVESERESGKDQADAGKNHKKRKSIISIDIKV